MTVKRPTLEQMTDIVESLGMTMTKERVGEFISLMDGSFAAYDIVDQMADEIPVVKYPRTPGYRPSPEENPLNAWYVKTDIQGAPKGKLKGKTVAVKDNVCVAGVPMMNGSSTLEGYVPEHRRDDRHAAPRRRRNDQGQGALRMLLSLRRQPHRRARSRAQPA